MGVELITQVCEATGLPVELIKTELKRLLLQEGVLADEATIEDLRTALSTYLQEVLVEAKESF